MEKTSSLQIISHDSDNPVIEFKSEYFTVNTTSSFDVSYSSLATLGLLGVSFEQSTAGLIQRVKYITTGTTGVPPNEVFYTQIGNDDEKSQLQVYGFIKGHYGLEIDGNVSFNNNFLVVGDSSFNNDVLVGGNLYVTKRSVFSLDVSMNGNLDIGSGTNSVAINKDISAGYAFDVSGLTILRNRLFVGSDASFGTRLFVLGDTSLNGNLFVNQDLSLNGNLFVGKRGVFALDVSMNGNVRLGTGNQSVFINKDISAGYALDVSGLTILRNRLFVGSDASFGTNLFVLGDTSLNGKLFVNQDLSVNGNLFVGGTASLPNYYTKTAIDSSINTNYYNKSAIDATLSGIVSGGTTVVLAGNVQVGSSDGFVTIDKPYFYSDPSLTIYYDFDTASYTGTTIANKGNGGAGYTATLQGTITGMIDSSEKKWGSASLKQNTAFTNK